MKPMKLHEATPDTRTKEQFVNDGIAQITGDRLASGMQELDHDNMKLLKSNLELYFDEMNK